MLSTARGGLPNSSIAANRSGSADSLPLPPTRSVSSIPGTKKISCTKPLPSTMFLKLSIRVVPERSGIKSWFGPATLTKPGLPPRGEASTLPSEPNVASTQNGHIAMNFFPCASISGRAFATTLGDGFGYIVGRSPAASSVTGVLPLRRSRAEYHVSCHFEEPTGDAIRATLLRHRLRRILDVGLGTVAAGGGFGVPFAVRGLVFDRLGAAGHALLGGGALGRRKRRGVGREGFRKHAVHGVGPAAV